ncbi:MAG: glycoside hydrolase family 3 C-terminal domain-containing protein [Bacteroidales bacterium]|jgi:beta-glucosidase-like glycosyl hydrolase|nr:glycoside hydrolase family 3 C-terminal domain-containing protein [Bacteroidales bacterium]
MKNKGRLLLLATLVALATTQAQTIKTLGAGSYASYPPTNVGLVDGYFAAPYDWFRQAYPLLNLHDNARNRPLPTNDWWTEFIFRGLGREQTTTNVTVTTDGDRFGCAAWAFPAMMTASANGFNLHFPKEFDGGGMKIGNPLRIHATTTVQPVDANTIYADFESQTFAPWVATNNTQNIAGPMATSEITQNPTPTGYTGNRFVNTFKGDAAQLTLTSPTFTISKRYIRLRAGGGNYPDVAYVGLFIGGTRVRTATGQNNATLIQHTWDVEEYIGQTAEIRIVDATGAGWGFIMCDEIVFTDSPRGGAGYTADFETDAAKVYDWSDLGFTLRSTQTQDQTIDATLVHGVPFAYFEMSGLYPILTPTTVAKAYNISGNEITVFPATGSAFTIEFDGQIYGVHVASGSKLHQSRGGDFLIETPSTQRYVVISVLPSRSNLTLYDTYARNKPRNAAYRYNYNINAGKIETAFALDAKNIETNAPARTLMCFMPHHYRNTEKNFDFIAGADYPTFLGTLHTACDSTFKIEYAFGGLIPYMPKPIDLSAERADMLQDLLDRANNYAGGRNGNTYAKMLGEHATAMLMARAEGHTPLLNKVKNDLKAEFADWLNFTDAERTKDNSFYFAEYPNYGAFIGFPPGYGSQGFNDLHFHYGYFTAGAARLMMVDNSFKADYAEMIKKIARTYANWQHDDYQPFLRNFDPYFGHSFAGGTGDGGGNNQESTSEALNSWVGLYLLGVELDDKEIIDAAAMGYVLERTAAEEYWLDLHQENFPPTYTHEYAGIVRTDNVGWGTYFSADPAWILGIQACPVDFFYTNFSKNTTQMAAISAAMLGERGANNADNYPGNSDPYDNYKSMGPYLGGYHLNILNYVEPDSSSKWLHEYCNDPEKGDEWRNHINTLTNYYQSNAMITYGLPAEDYHTSIASGAVYKNRQGELTYLLYNATDEPADVNIYHNNDIIATVRVNARTYYNSRFPNGEKPDVVISSPARLALNNATKVTATATDRDGTIDYVDFYFNGDSIGRSLTEPYEVIFHPYTAGTAYLMAIAKDNDGLRDTAVMEVEVIEQTPYNGTAWKIPSQTIYAVQFDRGGAEVSCHDYDTAMVGGDNYRAGTGVETENTNNLANSNIGWTNPGEWWKYTVEVAEAGVYEMKGYIGGEGVLRIFVDEQDVSGACHVGPTGGWEKKNLTIGVFPLPAGRHVLKVLLESGGINLGRYTFTKQPAVHIVIDVPYVQYLDMLLTPADTLGKDRMYAQENGRTLRAPTTAGSVHFIVQNAAFRDTFIYYKGTPLNVAMQDFRGNFDVSFFTLNSSNDTLRGIPLTAPVYNGMVVHVELTPRVFVGNRPPVADAGPDQIIYAPGNSVTLDGSRSADIGGEIVQYHWEQISGTNTATIVNPNQAVTEVTGLTIGNYRFRLTVTDDSSTTGIDNVMVSVLPPEQTDFLLKLPADSSMVTNTRRPSLQWEACPNATLYEVYLNITRSDYEWYASGNLLDRYTKVGQTTTTSFALPTDLPDRWTYKWYVIAHTPQGQKFSNRHRFGLYIPQLENENDGVNIVNGCRDMNKNGTIEPFEDWHLTPDERLDDIMQRLTRDEKIAQLFYGGNDSPHTDGFAFSYGVEGGMREVQRGAAQTRMGIPVGFFGDKVHGWKTIYPTQLGLAATRDPNLAYQCGNLHRIEQKGFGFTGTLTPLAEVDTKVLYPRFQEGNGENADEASAMVRAIVCGMQGGPELNPHSMVTTVKHWPAQGAGGESALQYDAATIGYHLKPWFAAIEANAASIMPGYNTAPYLDPTGAGANSSKPIIDYLRNEIRFEGFVITDWLAATTAQSIESISVGINVLGGAPSAPTDFDELVAAVGMEKIEQSTRKVLDMKIRTGMFENPYADTICKWTNAAHHSIALEAARKSVTLLTNNGILPLQPATLNAIVVGGPRAVWENEQGQHDQNRDPNVIWQSIYYDNPQAKTYLKAVTDRAAQDGITVTHHRGGAYSGQANVAVVVIGEQSYTHGTEWADKNPNIPEDQLQAIRDFKDAGLKVITVVILPRPYVLTQVTELSDAVFAVYRGGNGIAQATAECMFNDFSPSGKLPFQMPRSQDQVGTDNENNQVEHWELPYDIGASATERTLIRTAMQNDQPVPLSGDPLFQYGHGLCYGCDTNSPPPVDTTYPISSFSLISPANNSTLSETSVLLTWQAPTLADSVTSPLTYALYLDNQLMGEIDETSGALGMLSLGTHIWYVQARAGNYYRNSNTSFYFNVVEPDPDNIENIGKASLKIYPNPVSDGVLNIEGADGTIEIYNVIGRLVLTKEKATTINISSLSAGVYVVRVRNRHAVVIKK